MTPAPTDRVRLDALNLRGIAHPVRVRMLGLLRSEGPATASGLARRLGLNTGATSYHLRQLAEHGFIVDVPGKGVRRERWWQAGHADTAFPADELLADGDGLGATFLRSVGEVAADNLLRAIDARPGLAAEWRAAEDLSDYLLTLTPIEAEALTAEVHDVVRRHRDQAADEGAGRPADAVPVTFQFQLFTNPQREDQE